VAKIEAAIEQRRMELQGGSVSLPGQLEWVCDRAYLGTAAQSAFFVGSIVGGLIFGYIADHYGRLPALIACNSVGFFASIGTAFCNSFWTFAFARFIVGTSFDNCFNIIFIIGTYSWGETHVRVTFEASGLVIGMRGPGERGGAELTRQRAIRNIESARNWALGCQLLLSLSSSDLYFSQAVRPIVPTSFLTLEIASPVADYDEIRQKIFTLS
jgi:hypothetical protein